MIRVVGPRTAYATMLAEALDDSAATTADVIVIDDALDGERLCDEDLAVISWLHDDAPLLRLVDSFSRLGVIDGSARCASVSKFDFNLAAAAAWVRTQASARTAGFDARPRALRELIDVPRLETLCSWLLESAAATGACQCDSELAADVYCWTALASVRHEEVLHDLARAIDSEQDAARDAALWRRTLRDAIVLRDALRRICRTSAPPDDRIVLFIDDTLSRPIDRELRQTLDAARRALWPHCELLLWNPISSGGAFLDLHELIRAGDLGLFAELAKRPIQVCQLTALERSPQSIEIGQLYRRCAAIVVDQLFSGMGLDLGLHGSDLIRFFGRVVPSMLDRFVPPRAGDQLVRRVPVVAFSRSEDVELIETAIRSGADWYVSKSEPLRLTEAILTEPETVMAGAQMPRTFDFVSRLSPSQREAFAAAVVPGRSHHLDTWEPERAARGSAAERLLRAVPKAELHVHVGSCMTAEFLLAASLVGLAQKPSAAAVARLAETLISWMKVPGTWHTLELAHVPGSPVCTFEGGGSWMSTLAEATRQAIARVLHEGTLRDAQHLRSILHHELKVRDHVSTAAALESVLELPATKLALFALRMSDRAPVSEDVFIRTYLLSLAGHDGARVTWNNVNVVGLITNAEALEPILGEMYTVFWETGPLAPAMFRSAGWRPADPIDIPRLRVVVPHNAIQRALATGRTSTNLREYLEGCELSGALHLRHPFLIHLYAQTALHQFVREGIAYVELRGSPDGYVNDDVGFVFSDVNACLLAAFGQAQRLLLDAFRGSMRSEHVDARQWLPHIFFGEDHLGTVWRMTPRVDGHGEAMSLSEMFAAPSWLDRRLPSRVGLIFVGKRHKPTRELMLEAAAGAVMAAQETPLPNSMDDILARTSVVGFDLAGREPEYPPSLFTAEFERLTRLHIPVTVHAGENASAAFVEEAVIALRAQRIGHALALADDRRLMRRLREERICVELCPVSNHQTCSFGAPGDGGREYPIRKYLEAGIPVCLSTDNPSTSATTLTKEFLVAARWFPNGEMPVSVAMILNRVAFRSAFLPLPARRILLDCVDQYLEGFFQAPEVLQLLTSMRRAAFDVGERQSTDYRSNEEQLR